MFLFPAAGGTTNAADATCGASRREFLASCCVLSLGANQLFGQAQDFGSFEGKAVMGALIRTILPLEHPDFPRLSGDELGARLNTLFAVANDDERKAANRALQLFNRTDMFADMRSVAGDGHEQSAESRGLERLEHANWIAWRQSHAVNVKAFVELGLPAQRGYLRLWASSGFVERRRFYRSVKSMIMATAYSLEVLWQTIGYEGPLIP